MSEKDRLSASRTTSRASSVVSNAPSNSSALTHSSSILVTAQQSNLAAAFQSDGFLRHHHGPLPPPPPPPPPPRRQQTMPMPVLIERPKPKIPSPILPEPAEDKLSTEDTKPRPSQTEDIASANKPTSEPELPPPTITPAPVTDAGGPEPHSTSDSTPDHALGTTPADAPEPTSPVIQAALTPPPASSTTPVTRSHCRFHKISMPRGTDDSRIFFVVPGCSLSNVDLMRKQDIKDEGNPTYDETHRLCSDVESMAIDLNVIGILRQLVGIDLERETYYLPLPGEKPMRTNKKKARASNVDSISARNGLSRTKKARNVLASPAASTSASASVTTSPARSQLSVGSSLTGQFVSDGEEESETESQPAPKRRRRTKTASVDSQPAAADAPEDKPEGSKRPRKRKPTGKRPAGAVAYVPGNESDEGSQPSVPSPTTVDRPERVRRAPKKRTIKAEHTEYVPAPDADDQDSDSELEKAKTRRKRGAAPQGIKRARTTSDAVQGDEKPKKRKTAKA